MGALSYKASYVTYAQHVRRPYPTPDQRDQLAQDRVAGGVAEVVVHTFEVVDVDEHQGDGAPRFAGRRPLGRNDAIEVRPVPGPGQVVRRGVVLQTGDARPQRLELLPGRLVDARRPLEDHEATAPKPEHPRAQARPLRRRDVGVGPLPAPLGGVPGRLGEALRGEGRPPETQREALIRQQDVTRCVDQERGRRKVPEGIGEVDRRHDASIRHVETPALSLTRRVERQRPGTP
jgi:hypothetical protein